MFVQKDNFTFLFEERVVGRVSEEPERLEVIGHVGHGTDLEQFHEPNLAQLNLNGPKIFFTNFDNFGE